MLYTPTELLRHRMHAALLGPNASLYRLIVIGIQNLFLPSTCYIWISLFVSAEDKKAGSFGIARLVLCGLVLVVGAAVVYRCVSRGSQRLPEHGKKERGSPTRELPVTDYGYHVGVTKRK